MFSRSLLVFVFLFFAWNPKGSLAEIENAQGGILTSKDYSLQESSGEPEFEENLEKLTAFEEFKQIGSRFFYIEKDIVLDWFAAANMCYQLGGRLATIQSKEELQLIVPELKWDSAYWLDLNDLSEEGKFVSSATEEPGKYFNWRKGEPDNYHMNQHCVQLINYYMYDSSCREKRYFLCEA